MSLRSESGLDLKLGVTISSDPALISARAPPKNQLAQRRPIDMPVAPEDADLLIESQGGLIFIEEGDLSSGESIYIRSGLSQGEIRVKGTVMNTTTYTQIEAEDNIYIID